MKDLEATQKILGMKIQRYMENGKPWLSQQKYVDKIIQGFNMNNVKPINISLVSHLSFLQVLCPTNDEDKQFMSRVPYIC